MDAFFKRIENQYQQQLPFVVYRKPSEKKVKAIFQNTTHLHSVKDYSERGFVFAPFNDKEKNILLPYENVEEINYKPANSSNGSSHLDTERIDKSTKETYIGLIHKSLAYINDNVFEKVVLSRKEKTPLTNNNPLTVFQSLLHNYLSAFVYCWYHPKVGLWLGATPETLINIDGNHFSVMALAATQDYKGSMNVVWNDKEIQEQGSVTNFIVDRLQNLAEGIQVSKTDVTRAGNLLHLKTMISSKLKPSSSLNKIIKAIHPTPAVCGVPKEKAKEFILENENYNREFYTGFLGELNFEKEIGPRGSRRNIENRAYVSKKNITQLYVNLRCAKITNDEAYIFVGGGITKQSVPELEWEETVSKSRTMKSVL